MGRVYDFLLEKGVDRESAAREEFLFSTGRMPGQRWSQGTALVPYTGRPSVSLDDFIGELELLRQEIPHKTEAAVRIEMDRAVRRAKARFVPWISERKTRTLKTRTGKLAQSIAHRTRRYRYGIRSEFGIMGPGSGKLSQIAAVHEFGRVITTRPGGRETMAIPTALALGQRGVKRFRSVWAAAREYSISFTSKHILGAPRRGTPGWEQGRMGRRALYRRRTSVTIPPRPFLGPQVEPAADAIEHRVAGWLASRLAGGA